MSSRRRSSRLTAQKSKPPQTTKSKVVRRAPKKRVLQPTKSTVPEPEYFRLLDLPLDIRKEIYDYFAAVPKTADASKEEREALKQARESLLSVNRQIGSEWTPTASSPFLRKTVVLDKVIVIAPSTMVYANGYSQFYRTTTILLRQRNRDELGITSEAFENSFLKTIVPSKTSSIRKITYDVATVGRGGSDFTSLRSFARILNNWIEDLQSLEVVNLYSNTWKAYGSYSRIVPLQRPDPEQAWKLVGESGKWKEVETLLAHRARGAALHKNWQTCRRVTVRCWSNGLGVEYYWVATVVGLQFTKSRNKKTLGVSSNQDPIFDIKYSTVDGGLPAQDWLDT